MAVMGISGVFFRAKDPEALREWYKKNLGVCAMDENYDAWPQQAGPTVFMAYCALWTNASQGMQAEV